MQIWKTEFTIYNSTTSPMNNDTTLSLIGFQSNMLYFQGKTGNKIFYHNINVISKTESFLFFEILNNSLLWAYDITKTMSQYNSCKWTINITMEDGLLEDYVDRSMALKCLITNDYEHLPRYTKFDDSKSYFPGIEMIISTQMKVELFDYQKRSIAKMLQMERNDIENEIEYTVDINFKNLYNVKYDPIKNIQSLHSRKFKIHSKGGILADEMGLGKTITTLSLALMNPATFTNKFKFSESCQYWKINSKATLVICPSHLAKQWEEEAKKVNPKFKILMILTKRDHEKLYFYNFMDADIIITTHQFLMNFKYYPCLYYKTCSPSTYNNTQRNQMLKAFYTANICSTDTNDEEVYNTIKHADSPLFEFFNFHRLVLDEGHEIFGEMLSNASLSKYISEWLKTIDSNCYWFVSGSPFINYTGALNCIKYLNLKLIDEEQNIEIDATNLLEMPLFAKTLEKSYVWDNILKKICIRHRKSDITNEVNIFGYDQEIIWINFTDIESKLYESKKNKIYTDELQKLCCHPLILDANRRLFNDEAIDLSLMQEKLIEHHNKVITDYTGKLGKLDEKNQAYHMVKKSYENILTESRYMLNILNKINDTTLDENECSICLDIITDGSVTKCGHIFCTTCIKSSLKYNNSCPMCKHKITLSEIYVINKKEETIKEPINNIIEKYGSKLGKLILMVRDIVKTEDSRIIIFSQWDYMLSLIGKSLSENGIANCHVKGNVFAKNNAISKFKSGRTFSGEANQVMILSLKNCASGTNLTEATHIFFVEPINSSREEIRAIEGQAIGRACRLGQKQKIKIFRILIKDTIEETIYNNYYK